MKVLKVYLENSVIGGYFDKEFQTPTMKLFERFHNGDYKPIISSHVLYELQNGAPPEVIENLKTLDYEEYEVSEEMKKLAKLYLKQDIVTKKYYDDALHIAIATVVNVDVLVSWNFKHIVNFEKIRKFNSVNLKEGYNILEIRTPMEMIYNE